MFFKEESIQINMPKKKMLEINSPKHKINNYKRAVFLFYSTFKEKQSATNEILKCFQDSVYFRFEICSADTPEPKI